MATDGDVALDDLVAMVDTAVETPAAKTEYVFFLCHLYQGRVGGNWSVVVTSTARVRAGRCCDYVSQKWEGLFRDSVPVFSILSGVYLLCQEFGFARGVCRVGNRRCRRYIECIGWQLCPIKGERSLQWLFMQFVGGFFFFSFFFLSSFDRSHTSHPPSFPQPTSFLLFGEGRPIPAEIAVGWRPR